MSFTAPPGPQPRNYTACIVPSFLNFLYLTPVLMPERVIYHKGGFSEASPHSSSGPCTDISASVWLTAILNFQEPHVGHHLLQPAQQVGIEGGLHTVWEKETRDRIKALKMVSGDSRPLGSRALLLGATSLLFSVLASRKYLLYYNEVSLLCPLSRLPFY